jgi:hypothetical protein
MSERFGLMAVHKWLLAINHAPSTWGVNVNNNILSSNIGTSGF